MTILCPSLDAHTKTNHNRSLTDIARILRVAAANPMILYGLGQGTLDGIFEINVVLIEQVSDVTVQLHLSFRPV